MLQNGRYSAWFRSELDEGMAVISLDGGRISGGDTVLSYRGTYEQHGDLFTATIATERHSPGDLRLFPVDQVEIEIAGRSKARIASGAGSVKKLPGATFAVTLILMAD
ncbi:hypothetical protein [Tardiphaga sp.]|uniref:hypothetical protein n=1 Tax=Tardiphaga sp. TaxID=1926292 RepID=UPI002608A19A|nr:hypothetical protein [Tardiphaga sp.]MDB5618334.1 hypothetical protein [Tardiphaga sp.]